MNPQYILVASLAALACPYVAAVAIEPEALQDIELRSDSSPLHAIGSNALGTAYSTVPQVKRDDTPLYELGSNTLGKAYSTVPQGLAARADPTEAAIDKFIKEHPGWGDANQVKKFLKAHPEIVKEVVKVVSKRDETDVLEKRANWATCLACIVLSFHSWNPQFARLNRPMEYVVEIASGYCVSSGACTPEMETWTESYVKDHHRLPPQGSHGP